MLSFHLLVTTSAAALLIVAPAFGQAIKRNFNSNESQ
jgi:hypothetical protein